MAAGFRAEQSPVLWVTSVEESGKPVARVPNTSDSSDPAWQFAEHVDSRWWGLAEVKNWGFESDLLNDRTVGVAWSIPRQGERAELKIGLRIGDTYAWEEENSPKGKKLAALLADESQEYFKHLGELGAHSTLEKRLGAHLFKYETAEKGIAEMQIASLQYPFQGNMSSDTFIAIKRGERRQIPRSSWLNNFDGNHTQAISYSLRQVKNFVKGEIKRDRDQHRGYLLSMAKAAGLPSALTALSGGFAVAATNYLQMGMPELGSVSLFATAVAGLAAVAAGVLGKDRFNSYRSKLLASRQLPGPQAPSDHPTVVRRAGYPPTFPDMTPATHTNHARSRLHGST
jgi:hypothetical protein